MHTGKVALEAIVVAVVFVVVIMTLHAVVEMLILKKEKPDTHRQYMGRLAALGASAAVITHLAFELTGLNAQYCDTGAACMKARGQ